MLQISLPGSLTTKADPFTRRISRAMPSAFQSDEASSSSFTYGVLIPVVVLAGLFFHNLADMTVLAAPLESAPSKIEMTGVWENVLFPDPAASEIRLHANQTAKIDAATGGASGHSR